MDMASKKKKIQHTKLSERQRRRETGTERQRVSTSRTGRTDALYDGDSVLGSTWSPEHYKEWSPSTESGVPPPSMTRCCSIQINNFNYNFFDGTQTKKISENTTQLPILTALIKQRKRGESSC